MIYRDLKPENILVWSLEEHVDLNVKMIDFGTANFATSTGLYSVKGTRGFHAPEMLDLDNKEEYSFKVIFIGREGEREGMADCVYRAGEASRLRNGCEAECE